MARQESDRSLLGGSPGSTPGLEAGCSSHGSSLTSGPGDRAWEVLHKTLPVGPGGWGGEDFPTVKSAQIPVGERRVDKVTLGDPNTGIRPEAREQGEDQGCRCPRWPSAMYSRCHWQCLARPSPHRWPDSGPEGSFRAHKDHHPLVSMYPRNTKYPLSWGRTSQ